MKLLDIISEDTQIPFKNKCLITITNNNGEEIDVECEVPSTEEEKVTGLMYRDNLCQNCGMYYDYVSSGFWMKNVNFPIEMIFVNGDTIVDIKSAYPNDTSIIKPSEFSDGNIEVNEGFCENNNISIGNTFYKS
jgi:uncharacterized membrane protein (UPF0127 family)